MGKDEFLETVAEQIRCKRAREPVCEELLDHIECQTADYEQAGLSKEKALEKAVLEMGDPVEIGVAMDRVHRPKTSISMLVLAGAIGVFSILLHMVLGQYNADSRLGNYYMERQILYIVAGYVAMLFVYHLDYSILAGKSKMVATGLLAFTILGVIFRGTPVHGVYQNIRLFGGMHISVWTLLFLYVPVFGALLYDYRGMGYGVLWRIFLWAALPLILFWRVLASAPNTGILAGCLAFLFTVAVAKGWYRVSAKKVLAAFWSLFLATPAMIIGVVLFGDGEHLLTYRLMRLRAWFVPGGEDHYLAVVAKRILNDSSFFGRNVENLNFAVNEFPGFQDDYVLVTLVAAYGMVAGVLAVALLLLLVAKIFHISFKQKNRLGMIMGCGCGVVFCSQILLSVGVSLNWCPACANTLPFFCYGGSSVLLYYVLLGIVLSIYRYKEIPMKHGMLSEGRQTERMPRELFSWPF